MVNIETIQSNLTAIKDRISNAATRCGRDPGEIRLVAVGKTQPVECIRHAIGSGASIIGENYIQEAREKCDQLMHLNAQWHFIGHLQRNKAKYAVRLFDLIHSVDSIKLARELDLQARKAGKHQAVLVQVNISGEQTKSGVAQDQAIAIIESIMGLQNLQLHGLMTMPPFFDAPDKARPYFAALRKLRDRLVGQTEAELKELSMGMTGDFETAIEEGATLVRIGTALFGARR